MAETWFIWIMLYSVIGWIYETILCSVTQKRFVNRGFLNGPYCPIYGCGAALDIFFLSGIRNPLLLILAGAALASSLEYLTSWGMEKLFHARWWDYSKNRFNIKGRICLLGAIVFGVFSLALIRYIHPIVIHYTMEIGIEVIQVISWILFFFVAVDAIYTIAKFSALDIVLKQVSEQISNAGHSLKTINVKCYSKILHANSQIRRMLRVFPKLRSTRDNAILNWIRVKLLEERENKE